MPFKIPDKNLGDDDSYETKPSNEATVEVRPEKKDKAPPISIGRLVRLDQFDVEKDQESSQFRGDITLSDEQLIAGEKFNEWFEQSEVLRYHKRDWKKIFVLAGFAGTGKTTLVGHLGRKLCREKRVAFCSLAAMAASVLERSLKANGIFPEYCGTIHGLIYKPVTDEATGEVKSWELQQEMPYDLIVVDEASMIDKQLVKDITSFGIPVLAVGDGGQLTPVGEDTGLMKHPDAVLSTVRRQAMDNPILALSVAIRQGRDWRRFVKSCGDPRVQFLSAFDMPDLIQEKFAGVLDRPVSDDPLIMCGYNNSRAMLNGIVRSQFHTDEKLIPGERLVCLRNAYLNGMVLANGFVGKVQTIGYSPNSAWLNVRATFPNEGLELQGGMISKAQLGSPKSFKSYKDINPHFQSWRDVGMQMDYGYARTAHKAQGSQCKVGIIKVEDLSSYDEFIRWMYTTVTRCIDRVYISF